MNYRRNNKNDYSRKKKGAGFLVFLALGVIALFLFRKPILHSLSFSMQKSGQPLWAAANSLGATTDSYGYLVKTKQSVFEENIILQELIDEMTAKSANYETVLDENVKLKEILGRKENKNFILGAILAKPGQSLYDTLIIDIGSNAGIFAGQKVFAYGNVFIGTVAEVYATTSKVKLFSTPGEKTNAMISGKDISVEVIGRGGQNFEIDLPQGVEIEKGTEVVLPGIMPYVLGIVEEVISDPRDPISKLLLRSPINVQELKFVEVDTQK